MVLLKISEIAAYTGLHPKTIRKYIDDGELIGKKIKKYRYADISEIDKFLGIKEHSQEQQRIIQEALRQEAIKRSNTTEKQKEKRYMNYAEEVIKDLSHPPKTQIVYTNQRILTWLEEVVNNGTVNTIHDVINAIFLILQHPRVREKTDEFLLSGEDADALKKDFVSAIKVWRQKYIKETEDYLDESGYLKLPQHERVYKLRRYHIKVLEEVEKGPSVATNLMLLPKIVDIDRKQDFMEYDDWINMIILYGWFLADEIQFNRWTIHEQLRMMTPLSLAEIIKSANHIVNSVLPAQNSFF